MFLRGACILPTWGAQFTNSALFRETFFGEKDALSEVPVYVHALISPLSSQRASPLHAESSPGLPELLSS